MNPSWEGQILSKVKIEQRLARGGMAEVYLGRHLTLDRQVAVKILHSHLTGEESLYERFRQEAKAVASLRHPNIMQVYDFDVVDGRPYIVMELLTGMPFDEYLSIRHRKNLLLPPETTARVIVSLASALDYAHARGIIHRDIKPGNVILRREAGIPDPCEPLPLDAEPVLSDFGLARYLMNTGQSITGGVLGTPAYMSPEQVRGESVDSRADIYSLGVMLYEMLAGLLPFESSGETPLTILFKHLTEPPPPMPGASPALQKVLDRALAKDREKRFSHASDLAAELLEAVFGKARLPLPEGASSLSLPAMEGLLGTLELMVDQARAYEYAIPANNYPARSVIRKMSELARQALNEGRDLATRLEAPSKAPIPFSHRELEVLKLAALGLTNKEIAYKLGISERTIQFHMNSIFNKTGTQSRTEAVALALRSQWIPVVMAEAEQTKIH